jgi:hypothetical protein
MAKLYISEFQFMGANTYDESSIARQPSLVNQTVDFSGGAAASAAFSANTTYIRVWSDTQCCMKFGAAPVATTTDTPMAPSQPEYFGVTPAQKLSAVILG